jgi:hypothetical protein
MTLMLAEKPTVRPLSEEEALVIECRQSAPCMLVIEERERPVRLEAKANHAEATAELVRIMSAPGAKDALSPPRFGQGGAE